MYSHYYFFLFPFSSFRILYDHACLFSELSKQVQKLEEAVKQSTGSLETLKKEMEILESIKLQLKKENGDLETRVKNKEEALAAKEEELEDARIKMNQMMEIQNMIYNISSRRVLE
ncbi:hypothetical protein E2C01_059470 [Portunus trituberculatus]|uniref:Uncharacterized protein n=1 Tax=Portunus trituberculatus TaxID=210409 RepID=A0A5B7H7U3_PORTR|nr:hypothetical protein [Portunus trituberculatus]